MMRKLWAVIEWVLPVLLWILFAVIGGVFGAISCGLMVLWFGWLLRVRKQKKEEELSGGFEAYASALLGLSEKEIVTICIMDQLRQESSEKKLIAKKTVKLRLLYTVIFSLLNVIFIAVSYASDAVIVLFSLLFLIYILLMLSTSTASVLRRIASRNQKKDFAQLVQETTFDECKLHRSRRNKLAGIAVFVGVLSLFAALHSKEKWEFAEYEDGVQVVSYQPSILGGKKVIVPEEVDGKPVYAIGKQAFADNDRVAEVQLPDRLRSIASGAFMDCSNLQRIDLPSGLMELQGEAFMNCKNLQRIRIPEGVTAIRGNTFDGCAGLESVELHDGITAIHAFAFRGCSSLETIELPSGITEIREQTFAECGDLRSIDIPEGVTKIGARAFYLCSDLESVNVPLSLVEIRSSAFRDCSKLKKIQLPKGTVVAENAFKDSPTKVTYDKFTEIIS